MRINGTSLFALFKFDLIGGGPKKVNNIKNIRKNEGQGNKFKITEAFCFCKT
jgi:hypothetical protein